MKMAKKGRRKRRSIRRARRTRRKNQRRRARELKRLQREIVRGKSIFVASELVAFTAGIVATAILAPILIELFNTLTGRGIIIGVMVAIVLLITGFFAKRYAAGFKYKRREKRR